MKPSAALYLSWLRIESYSRNLARWKKQSNEALVVLFLALEANFYQYRGLVWDKWQMWAIPSVIHTARFYTKIYSIGCEHLFIS